MRKSYLFAAALSALTGTALAAPVLTPMTSFGNGDGWRAPNEIVTGDLAGTATGSNYNYLQAANLERGMAYNSATGHLLVASRFGATPWNVRILDGSSGVDLGGLNMGSGTITGGTNAINQVGVAADGAIYVNNLTTNTTSSTHKIYRWANESAAPAVAFSTAGSPLAGARLGDSMDVTGSGTNTRIVAGYGSTPAVAGNNGYAVFTTADGSTFSGTHIAFTGSPPAAGDFRLGVTFGPTANDVYGSQGSTLYRVTSYSGTTGTLAGSPALSTSAERLLDYGTLLGMPLLAVQSTGDSTVRIYDVTVPTAPVLLASANATLGTLTGNGNGTGMVQFGAASGDTIAVYAMSTNQGIQAFTFQLPEPASLSLLSLAGVAMLRRRK